MVPYSSHKTRLMVKKLEGHTFFSYSSVAKSNVKHQNEIFNGHDTLQCVERNLHKQNDTFAG